MTRVRLVLMLSGLLLAANLGAPVHAAAPDDHPFALVNVVDLYDLFALDPNMVDTGFDVQNPPPNWAQYLAEPRVGTNPASVAVNGDRMWISGFWNGYTWQDGASEAGWYASLGIAEVSGIAHISGYGAEYKRYADSFLVGPTVTITESFTGLDYDPVLGRLYATKDDPSDVSYFGYPSGAPAQVGSVIAAYDADPNSVNWGARLWAFEDPFHPGTGPFSPSEDRLRGGIAVNPLNPQDVIVERPKIDGLFLHLDTLSPTIDQDPNNPQYFNVKDLDIQTTVCPSSWYRQIAFQTVTGDMYLRNSNAVARVFADPLAITFQTIPRTIQEPRSGGNGTADTTAIGDDVQLIPVGNSVEPGGNIIGAGPNGVVDTAPGSDDEYSTEEIVADRPVGNVANDIGDNCNDDPTGFPNGPEAQGQGIAVIPSSNIPGLDVDLIVANNRPRSGSGLPKDVRVYTVDGEFVADLELPCSPPADEANHKGIAYYGIDYDPESGTLVVLEFEQRKAYVFKADITGSSLSHTRYDWDRDGQTDLTDFAAFQSNYTGAEYYDGLSLSAQRLNTDSDCDIDYDDYLVFEEYWDTVGGP